MRSVSTVANRVIEVCESTNALAKELAEQGYPQGTFVSAKRQEAGRGRHGRKWESPEGNLFLSIISRVQNVSLWSWIPLAAATSVVEVLRSVAPTLPLEIKWPNDLWIRGRKCGGILCEGSAAGEQAYVVVGIGLNCSKAPALPQDAIPSTSLAEEVREASSVHADVLRPQILLQFEKTLAGMERFGFGGVGKIYESVAVTPVGVEIEWGVPPVRGIVVGLGDAGELRVRDENGAEKRLYAEEIRTVRKVSYGSLV